jgi:outer membrane receptor protein involved in Fe transport
VLNSLSEKYNMRLVGVSSFRGLAAALFGTTFAATGMAADDSSTSGVQEVVVTAQRRSENLQTVPLSVTALDNSSIERMGITTLKDLAREVPPQRCIVGPRPEHPDHERHLLHGRNHRDSGLLPR